MVNGDFSRGASGFFIENGEIQHAVEEITIAGNLKDSPAMHDEPAEKGRRSNEKDDA